MSVFRRDPDSVLPFTWDWSDWLAAFPDEVSPTIDSHEIDADEGITVVSSSNDFTSVTAVISGGTAGSTYSVTCRITLDTGPPYVDERTIRLVTEER